MVTRGGGGLCWVPRGPEQLFGRSPRRMGTLRVTNVLAHQAQVVRRGGLFRHLVQARELRDNPSESHLCLVEAPRDAKRDTEHHGRLGGLQPHPRSSEYVPRHGEGCPGRSDVAGVQQHRTEVELGRRVLHGVTPQRIAGQPFGKSILLGLRHDVYPPTMNAIVACFGNVLRADDGVGPAVALALLAEPLPDGVRVLEVGIGGIHLVQELLDGADVLLVVDAVDLGRPPGTVVVQRPDVLDVSTLSVDRRRDELADMHLATPARALMVALGLGVLPATTLIVGVQTTDTDEPRHGLSEVAIGAVPAAVREVHRLLAIHGVDRS